MWCSVLKWAVCLFRAPYASSLGCKHRPGAVSVVLGSYESSWAVSVVLGSYESSWGRKRRPWAVRVVLAQYLSSLGRTCRPGDVRMVLEPCVSSWRRTHGPWAVRIVLVSYVSSLGRTYRPGLYAPLLGCTRRYWAVHIVVVGLYAFAVRTASVNVHQGGAAQRGVGHPSCIAVVRRVVVVTRGRFVHLRYGVALKEISGEKMKEGRAKTSHDKCRGSFRDAPAGPPTSWVPP